MADALEPVYKLTCSCNQYPWGKQGSQSLSAQLCAKQPGWDGKGPRDKTFQIDEGTPYAEMWMGTYPVLPSYVAATGEDLQDLIDRHPEQLVGRPTIQKFGHTKLPFLPKILSIAKALPLQVHPDKARAARLHAQKPDQFTDPNHKPEIALALTEFEAFCGFKPLERIAQLLQLAPLRRFLPSSSTSAFDDETLRGVVHNMLKADDATVKDAFRGLQSLQESELGPDAYIQRLAPRLAAQYTEVDPGTLVALVTMNYLVLQPGESISIPADGIHAYLAGDIVECMARSNNVLNTGFCPRAQRDNVDVFCDCLTFTPHDPDACLLKPQPSSRSTNHKTVQYRPPMSEFDMLQVALQPAEKEGLRKAAGPGIMIATKGNALLTANGRETPLKEGSAWFVPQGTELEFEAGVDGLLLHMAYVE